MQNAPETLAPVLISLLKGVLNREQEKAKWQDLLKLESAVRDYIDVLGLELVIFEDEGFAYLKNRENEEQDDIPRLIAKRQLSYPVSLILALLRRKLAEHDASSAEVRLVFEKAEFIEELKTYFTSGTNEAQFTKKMESHLKKISDLGFISFIGTKHQIEVNRILKAFIDAQWLKSFDENLNIYLEYGSSDKNGEEDE
jgi:hypothetical protein